MTATCFPGPLATFSPTASNKVISGTYSGTTIGVFRLPTDPLYYATLTIQNVVSGSRYRVTRADTGAELATGTGGGSDIVIAGIPCYANPMLVDIKIRNASGATKYKPFETAAYIYKTGGSSYVIQQVD